MRCVQMSRGSLHIALAVAILTLVLGDGPTDAAELLRVSILPLSLASEAAQASLAACEKQGFHISVAVTDQSGLVRVLMRDDHAAPHTLDSSMKKAYTAASLGLSTAVLAKIVAQHPDAAGLSNMNEKILLLQGGLPIQTATEVVGGIGVGGTPAGETDEACARAGLDKIGDRLR